MQRQEREASLVDLDLQLVDSGISGDDLNQRLVVPLDQPAHRPAQALFGEAAHRQQPSFQFFQFLDEVTALLIHGWIRDGQVRVKVAPMALVRQVNTGEHNRHDEG